VVVAFDELVVALVDGWVAELVLPLEAQAVLWAVDAEV